MNRGRILYSQTKILGAVEENMTSGYEPLLGHC